MAVKAKSRSRTLVAALCGAILLAAVLMIGLRGGWGISGRTSGRGAGVERARPAGRGGLAAAIRENRFGEAFAACARPGAEPLGADDLGALGRALLDRDRLVLGWTALETARRIDPAHPSTNRALDELEGKLIRAVGREQVARRDAVDVLERLRAVGGAPALGLLVLGLAAHGGDPGDEREFLDRLLTRERSVLAAVETPADAVKLVARLLMETRRPAEAGELLGPMADGPGADREAAWLLSRAALQLGRDDTADAMLERAAGFGRRGSSPEPAPFVGSRACARCHPSAYRAAQGASPHARTIYRGTGLKDVPLPDRPVPDPLDPQVTHSFRRNSDDRIALEIRDTHGQVARAVVAYALGSGEHGITMVSRDEPSGLARELRISYYATDRSWRATKGIDAIPHGLEEFIGMAIPDKSLEECLNCHTTWFRAVLPIPSRPVGPESTDRGIGCERCHGPGLNHVKAVESGFAELAVAVTHESPPARLLKSCNECHASNGTIDPGDLEFTRVQGTTLQFSSCFTATGGAIHCATCHDPHRGLDRNHSHYESRCLACHGAAAAGNRDQGGRAACRVNPTSGCIDCHMPKVTDSTLQARFTDHHIRVHPAAGLTAGGGHGTTRQAPARPGNDGHHGNRTRED